jgi:hypothetical protein
LREDSRLPRLYDVIIPVAPWNVSLAFSIELNFITFDHNSTKASQYGLSSIVFLPLPLSRIKYFDTWLVPAQGSGPCGNPLWANDTIGSKLIECYGGSRC